MELQNNLRPGDYGVALEGAVQCEDIKNIFYAADLFIAMLEEVIDTEVVEPGVFFEYVLHKLPNEVLGQMLLHMPIIDGAGRSDPDGRIDRGLALAAADELGPDWAQAWYRFAVLVTKLA